MRWSRGGRLLTAPAWKVLAALLAARAGFAAVEALAGVIHWRVFARRRAVEGFLAVLRSNRMPPRQQPEHDLGDYLATVQAAPGAPEAVRPVAGELEQVRRLAEAQGILSGVRTEAAMQAALDRYSPV